MKSFITFLLLLPFPLIAQEKADSLLSVLATQKEDSNKVNTLNNLAWEYYLSESNTSLKYAKEALALSEKISFDRGAMTALNTIGIAYYFKGNYPLALEHYIRATRILEDMPTPQVKRLSALYNNIATVLLELRRYKDAEDYFTRSLKADGELGDKLGMAQCYNNIGLIHKDQGNYDKALKYYFKAYALRKEINDKEGMPSTLTNIGVAYVINHNTKLGERYLNEAVQLYKQNKDTLGLAIVLNSVADLFDELKDYEKALRYFDTSLTISRAKGYLSYMSYSYSGISGVYAHMKNFEQAYEYHRKYMHMKDSIYNKENSEQFAEMQTKYETEKKEKEIVKSHAESEKQTVLRNTFIAGFAGMLLLAFFIFRQYRNKKRLSIELFEQKQKVETQRDLIEEKQKEILDSMHYAKRIQQSLLPNEKIIARAMERLKGRQPAANDI